MRYPKRLIEVDLPIKEVSAHARREKSIRHGHISTLHIWWARRPLAACRAVICAALWPDPADPDCPQAFRDAAARVLQTFAGHVRSERRVGDLCLAHQKDWIPITARGFDAGTLVGQMEIRKFLLWFIADFANWDASTVPEFLEAAQALTQEAHQALGGEPGSRSLLVDPFAGGGAMPLEALRVGADAFASDLNPVAVLINKVELEYAPRFGDRLIVEMRKWAEWIQAQATRELGSFYPVASDGCTPVTYLWARTITCEGPGCGTSVPLLRSLWLERKGKHSTALRFVPAAARKDVDIRIVNNAKPTDVSRGTSRGGAATCPNCGYTTPVESIRVQLSNRAGGAKDARLIAVVTVKDGETGHRFREPDKSDFDAANRATVELRRRASVVDQSLPLVPEGEINHLRGFFNVVLYGNTKWGDLFSDRQLLALTTFARLVREAPIDCDPALEEAVRTCLATLVDRVAVRCTANCIWDATTSCIMQIFNQGQSLPARWEFAEMFPFAVQGSGWLTSLDYSIKVLEHLRSIPRPGVAARASAVRHPLPDDSADGIITDPPYYAAVPYADLSDFFFSWLKRSLSGFHPDLFGPDLVEKESEIVSLAHRAAMYRNKDNAWFENQMRAACEEARRICRPSGTGLFVFANKETAAWEAMLAALVGAGWIVTASWPIDTESGNRLRAKNSAALASSVHLVCRPRETPDGSLRADDVGDWRDVLAELPTRIHEWMPRLAKEGVVGADAIFACLGPALEVFSRYSRVEKASGEAVPLREYLEHVWAAVSREALSMIFESAEASGYEEDARLTAMWLWTLSTGAQDDAGTEGSDDEDADDDGDSPKKKPTGGFVLEFDAARKIAQGLGAHLEELDHVIEVKGSTARLRSVNERTRYLFGKDQADAPTIRKARKPSAPELFAEFDREQIEGTWGEKVAPKPGATTLDRVHQAMILFAAGRTEALRRFVVDDGVGNDPLFWRLAQALSALYPGGAEEKRWVDGLLARKRSLGFG